VGKDVVKFVKANIEEPVGILLKVAKNVKVKILFSLWRSEFYVHFWQLCFRLPKTVGCGAESLIALTDLGNGRILLKSLRTHPLIMTCIE
jgi:hypothetical protein